MRAVKIVHLFPDLLNLYGDKGNITCLKKRCEWRGIPIEVEEIHCKDMCDFKTADIVFLGAGPDREQKFATEQLFSFRDALEKYIEDEGVVLAICGGYQILGSEWVMGTKAVEGLSLLELTTRPASEGKKRFVGDVVLESSLSTRKIVGYENHAGQSYLGGACVPFGQVYASLGNGNNGEDGSEGVLYKNLIGSYLHGPLLAKNPEIGDVLLKRASHRRKIKGEEGFSVVPLDDSLEHAAADFMLAQLKA